MKNRLIVMLIAEISFNYWIAGLGIGKLGLNQMRIRNCLRYRKMKIIEDYLLLFFKLKKICS